MSATRIPDDRLNRVVVTPANVAAALPADAAWRALLDDATAPYRQAGGYAWHFARGKLGRDPDPARRLAAYAASASSVRSPSPRLMGPV